MDEVLDIEEFLDEVDRHILTGHERVDSIDELTETGHWPPDELLSPEQIFPPEDDDDAEP